MLYYIKAQDRRTTGIAVLRYGVTLSASLQLFTFFILVFHLKQKHEEGQRLLHYLQQTNTAFYLFLSKILEFPIDFPIRFAGGTDCDSDHSVSNNFLFSITLQSGPSIYTSSYTVGTGASSRG
jgi:hypothetical protein